MIGKGREGGREEGGREGGGREEGGREGGRGVHMGIEGGVQHNRSYCFHDCMSVPDRLHRGYHDNKEGAVEPHPKQRYDIFLSFAQGDRDFAEEVKTRLQTKRLKVFIPSEGVCARVCVFCMCM